MRLTYFCLVSCLPYLQGVSIHLKVNKKCRKKKRRSSRNGPRQANLVLIAYASSEGSGEPAHPRSLARTFAARSYKQWVKRNLQTESQIPGPSELLGMRSWNVSWRNARRHKFAWRGSNNGCLFLISGILWWATKLCQQPTMSERQCCYIPRESPYQTHPCLRRQWENTCQKVSK